MQVSDAWVPGSRMPGITSLVCRVNHGRDPPYPPVCKTPALFGPQKTTDLHEMLNYQSAVLTGAIFLSNRTLLKSQRHSAVVPSTPSVMSLLYNLPPTLVRRQRDMGLSGASFLTSVMANSTLIRGPEVRSTLFPYVEQGPSAKPFDSKISPSRTSE